MHGDPAPTGHGAARRSRIGSDARAAVRQLLRPDRPGILAARYLGEDVARFIKQNVHPLDIVFRLARDHGIVVLNGGGFHAPDWSVRVSFANLDDDVYDDIGRAIRHRAGLCACLPRGATGRQPPAMPEPAWPKETMR